MADRAAAERACKDPNPNIDGRKANVNLAYLGAKPRSLQTGESPVFLPWHFWLLYSALVSVGWKRRPPPPPPSRGGSRLSCAPREPSQSSHLPAWKLNPFLWLCVPVGQGEEGASPGCQLSSPEGGSCSLGLEVGRTDTQRLLPLGSLGLLRLGVSGSRGGGLGGERKLVNALG